MVSHILTTKANLLPFSFDGEPFVLVLMTREFVPLLNNGECWSRMLELMGQRLEAINPVFSIHI